MTDYSKHEELEAFQWIKERSEAHWSVWWYERSTRMIVLNCRFGEAHSRIGFLVLRGVQIMDMTASIGTATFALSTSRPEHTGPISETEATLETMQVLQIVGEDQNTVISFQSMSAYELQKRTEENL